MEKPFKTIIKKINPEFFQVHDFYSYLKQKLLFKRFTKVLAPLFKTVTTAWRIIFMISIIIAPDMFDIVNSSFELALSRSI